VKLALYARVSTERQEIRGTIGSQLEILRGRAASDGHQVVDEFLDDGYSGARLDRPGLDALRDAAEAGLFEAVLCLTPDRLARAHAYQFLILEELARHRVRVLFTDAPPLDDDPQVRLLTQMQGVIAEYRSRSATGAASSTGLGLGRRCSGRCPTPTDALHAAPRARHTWWRMNRKRGWCAASLTTTWPAATPSDRSSGASRRMVFPPRSVRRSGAARPSPDCYATEPMSVPCSTTALKSCPGLVAAGSLAVSGHGRAMNGYRSRSLPLSRKTSSNPHSW
jgi:hypothetical protein